MNEQTALVTTPAAYALSVQEVKNQVMKVQELMSSLMIEGEHYGESFPGDTKKNLLKPGADKLNFMFRLRAEYEQRIVDLPGLHREVHTKCTVYHIESGTKISEGVGSCSTMESKYRWRNSARKCPSCGMEAIIKGKEEYGGGWVCFKKKGGCGANFADDDQAITGQVAGKVENPDIADTYNTVTKISAKRAYVAATITATAASDIFSQDAEDLAGDDHDTSPRNAKPSTRSQPVDGTQPAKTAEGAVHGQPDFLAILDAAEASGKLSAKDSAMWRGRLNTPGAKKGAEDWITKNLADVKPASKPPAEAPTTTPNQKSFKAQYETLSKELVDLMASKAPNGLPMFNDDDKAIVREKTTGLTYTGEDIDFLRSVIETWKKVRDTRLTAFQKPISQASQASAEALDASLDAAADQGFEDDVPSTQPTATGPADQGAELDIF